MMSVFLKKTQTLIASLICSIVVLLFIYPNITRSQVTALYDPLSVPNNKFGIHILTSSTEESSPAADLVNSNGGDWGYITVLIESKNRDHTRWQNFFDDLRRRHLIPLVRISTQAEGDYWKRPYEGEELAWADFLNGLNWPTKNRYVIIYNEPNHGSEWGNSADPADYAKTLDKTITALKDKSSDFFVLNGGMDAATPHKLPAYEDEADFLSGMEKAVPGIFNKLDGWVSHSYPTSTATGGISTFRWELNYLQQLGLTKPLPVFITETGWRHAEGIKEDDNLPSSEVIGSYLQTAFSGVWSDPSVVTVTPFLLNYQQEPFDHFSFKRINGDKQQITLPNSNVLGVQNSFYYPQYQMMMDLSKVKGLPLQENKAQLTKGVVPTSVVDGEEYSIPLTFKNIGESIWGDTDVIKLISDHPEIIPESQILSGKKVEPGQEYTFNLKLKSPPKGTFNITFNLFHGATQFDNQPWGVTVAVKDPVKITVRTALTFKSDPSGSYKLTINTPSGDNTQTVQVQSDGTTDKIEAKGIYPDSNTDVTLSRAFYRSKTIHVSLTSGEDTLDFGTLTPDLGAIIQNPIGFFTNR